MRAAPADEAEQVTQLVRGEPVVVVARRGAWAEIRTAYDYPGWVRGDALGGDADPAWLAPPGSGDPVQEARRFLGAPYLWGGMTERGIDCSGLVHMAYRRAGTLVPRDADQQEEAGDPLREEELRPGDLVTYGDRAADHIAFWLGGDRILHATRRGAIDGVLEEREPEQLRPRRRLLVRLRATGGG